MFSSSGARSAAVKQHCSYYFPNSGSALSLVEPELLGDYEWAKGTLRFPVDKVPRTLAFVASSTSVVPAPARATAHDLASVIDETTGSATPAERLRVPQVSVTVSVRQEKMTMEKQGRRKANFLDLRGDSANSSVLPGSPFRCIYKDSSILGCHRWRNAS